MVDVRVDNQGTVWAFHIESDEARAWVDEHVATETWQWLGLNCFAVDHRLAADLVEGMQAEGFDLQRAGSS